MRTAMIQLAWLWPRHQPGSALARWFIERTRGASKPQKKMAVALARKLLVALWKGVDAGVVIEGAVLKSAARASRRSATNRSFFTNPPRSDQPRSIRVGEPMDCLA